MTHARCRFPLELTLIFFLIATDLLIKQQAPNAFYNHNFAFSLPLPPVLTTLIALSIIIAALTWLYLSRRLHIIQRFALIVFIAGGAANTYERVWRGYVTDIFLYSALTINLADIFIWLGVGILLFSVLIPYAKPSHAGLP